VVLDALSQAFSAGAHDGAFPFDEYEAIRQHFRKSDIPVGPTIDLDVLEPEDLESQRQRKRAKEAGFFLMLSHQGK
jgi:hypothetical protein